MSSIVTSIAADEPTEVTAASASQRTKVGFVSLGCPKNLVDSEVMMGMLAQAGAELTSRAEEADVIVVNTCSFIESAQQESVNTILEMVQHKNAGRARKLVVAGCLVERFRDQIRKNIPEVDAVVGTGELENILAAAGVAENRSSSPFKILQSRPEGDLRAAQGRFARDNWDGAIADLPNYLYDEATPRLLGTIAANEKICSYIDVPLQHASPAVLKRMKRGGGAEIFLRSIEKMRRAIPDVTVRSSFIVGFPGETDKEFNELCDFVRAVGFDWMGAFGYSDEKGAGAYAIDGKISGREIERRRKHLMQIQRTISKQKKRVLIGKEFDLLLEGSSEESDLLLEGRTAMHAPEIDGKVFVNDAPDALQPVAGEFYRCKITEAHDYDLIAKIV